VITFSALAAAFCGHDDVGLDVDEDTIPAAVRDAVPAVLLRLWREVGGAPQLLTGFHRFRPLAELELHEDHVLFLDEHQDVVIWGVARGDDAVMQFPVVDDGLDGPFAEGARLEDFLRAMLVMQATHGADVMPHVGYVERGVGTAAALSAAGLTALPAVGGLTALFAPGIAATIVADDDGETVIVATRASEDLERFAAALDIDLDVFEL